MLIILLSTNLVMSVLPKMPTTVTFLHSTVFVASINSLYFFMIITDFESKLADKIKSDSKSFYAYFRSKQRSKDKGGPLKDSLGKIITDNEEAANTLNTYFG